jgi:hypothetical protein
MESKNASETATLLNGSNSGKSQKGTASRGSMAEYWLKKLVPYVSEDEKSLLFNKEIASALINQLGINSRKK